MQIDLKHLEYAAQIADEAVKNGPQPCALIAVADREKTLWTHVSPGADGVGLDSIFLIASITKPIVTTAATSRQSAVNRPMRETWRSLMGSLAVIWTGRNGR